MDTISICGTQKAGRLEFLRCGRGNQSSDLQILSNHRLPATPHHAGSTHSILFLGQPPLLRILICILILMISLSHLMVQSSPGGA